MCIYIYIYIYIHIYIYIYIYMHNVYLTCFVSGMRYAGSDWAGQRRRVRAREGLAVSLRPNESRFASHASRPSLGVTSASMK